MRSTNNNLDETLNTGTPVLNDAYEINVLVMSKAGKLIFSRFGVKDDVVKSCAMIAAIRSSLVDNNMFGLGDLDTMRSEELTIAFMSVGSITLIATSPRSADSEYQSEAYLRLLLEYMYCRMLFTLTEQVQTVLEDNPGFDLGNLLGSTESDILGILDETGQFGKWSLIFTGGVEIIFPIQSQVREEASRALYTVGKATANTVFALLLVDDKLLTIVQPHYRPHQMRSSDLHLIVNFMKHQPGILTSELWVPMCLPRFNSKGFLYAYSTCLNDKLTLILLSQQSTTDQFKLFQRAAESIRQELGLPSIPGSVLRIVGNEDLNGQGNDVTGDDVAWRRSEIGMDEHTSEEDYVNVSVEAGPQSMIAAEDDHVFPFLEELEKASKTSFREELLEDFCTISSAIHFCFRIDVPVQNGDHKSRRKHTATAGSLSQVINSPLDFPFVTPLSKRHVCNMYQKLNLRLRLGASTAETTMEALDATIHHQTTIDKRTDSRSIVDVHCPGICMAESFPDVDGIAYIKDGGELFIGLSGDSFELYMALPSTIPPHDATALGGKLIRTIRAKENDLFLVEPLTW